MRGRTEAHEHGGKSSVGSVRIRARLGGMWFRSGRADGRKRLQLGGLIERELEWVLGELQRRGHQRVWRVWRVRRVQRVERRRSRWKLGRERRWGRWGRRFFGERQQQRRRHRRRCRQQRKQQRQWRPRRRRCREQRKQRRRRSLRRGRCGERRRGALHLQPARGAVSHVPMVQWRVSDVPGNRRDQVGADHGRPPLHQRLGRPR